MDFIITENYHTRLWEDVADSVWIKSPKLRAEDWAPYDDRGMKLMMNEYKEQIKKGIELKDLFLSYCDDTLKKKDVKYHQYYEIVKKTQSDKD